MSKEEYVIYSIRIPSKLRELMKMVDVDWSSEIREFIRRRVMVEYRRRLLSEVKEIHKSFKDVETPPSWVLIRRDREER